MRGSGAVKHVRLLGLRADEPSRVARVLSRTFYAEGATSPSCTVATQPPGERPYFPLFDAGLNAGDVIGWWKNRGFDLDIPSGAGNCVFCFMKGTRKLAESAAASDPRRAVGHPTDIGWWADFERRHMRTAPKRGGGGVSKFGFFGANTVTFSDIAQGAGGINGRYATGTPACDCTD